MYFLRCRSTTATNIEGRFLRAVVIASFSHRFSYFREDVTIIQSVFPRSKLSVADRGIVLGDLNLTGNV